MTNEIIAEAVQRIDGLQQIVIRGPLGSHIVAVLWSLLNLSAPIFSGILCFRARRQRLRGQETRRSLRLILGAALFAAAATAITVLEGLYNTFCMVATTDHGTTVDAMHNLNIARQCSALVIGVVASSLCLLCALCLPSANSGDQTANKASDATMEPAPGADSPAHQG